MEQNGFRSRQRRRIGLLPTGGKGWIAGAIYLKNIILALHCLPSGDRPDLFLIRHIDSSWDPAPELKGTPVKSRYYSHRRRGDRKSRSGLMKQSLLAGKWPCSYESLVLRLGLHALFPVCESLGKDFPVPWIGWIPDLQHKRLPQFFSADELRRRDQRFQRMAEEAPQLVVSSEDAYNDLMRWFPMAEGRASVLSFPMVPVAQWYAAHPESVVEKFHLPAKFLMFPSQFWAHKNHRVLFDAMRLLKQKGIEDIALVCTGFQEDYRAPEHLKRLRSFMNEHRLGPHIFLLGLLERVEQIQLLRSAAAVVQPSLFEGWSSLLEDCRSLGKRIYVSDIPVHREQKPAHARFFDPHDAGDLAERIAGDWGRLTPGPDAESEKQGREEAARQAVGFGKRFLQIVEKAHQARNH